jgi:hypothetical protein
MPMAHQKPKFYQAEVTRLLKGAQTAGYKNPRVQVTPDGRLTLITDEPEPEQSGMEWDNLR